MGAFSEDFRNIVDLILVFSVARLANRVPHAQSLGINPDLSVGRFAPDQLLKLVRWATKVKKTTGERSEPSEKKFYNKEFLGCAQIDHYRILLLDFLLSLIHI